MMDVVKKGLIEVKKRGRFGGYKPKYVSLINNSLTHKCKTVELLDPDGLKSSPEVIRLTDVWSVQDKPSKTRYLFELVLGEDPVITFSCATMVERDEWIEAFRVLNLLALPSLDALNSTSPHTEYSPVNMLKNRSAVEIGRSGQFLLSITSSAIVLHWKTGAIAHHWPTKNIMRLHHPGKDGHLFLIVKRVSGSGPPLEFEFVTTKEQAVQILKLWNVRLLESIPGQTHSLNDMTLSSAVTHTGGKAKRSTRKSKSFKDKDRRIEDHEDLVKRTSSFTRFGSYGTGLSAGSNALSQGSQPLTAGQRISWNEFSLESQDSSYSSRFGPGASSPPPLPPRPVESSSDEDDPDYAYIDESEVKGPSGVKVQRTPSDELDDQLKALRKSISRENKIKAREKLRRRGTSPQFAQADPQDYLVPVPSKRSQSHSTSSVSRDLSDPIQDLSPSSPDSSPVFMGPPPSLPPRVGRSYGVNENTELSAKDYSTPAPPIPPRSPTREFLSRKSSSSSSHSAGSAGHHHRCPKCHSLKKSKSSVSKTVSDSQEHRGTHSYRTPTKEESRKSMPNLEHEVRNHHHRHCCSSQDSLNARSREYLQLVEDKGPGQENGTKGGTELGELSMELDLLSSCLEALNNPSTDTQSPAKKKRNPYDHINLRTDEPPPPSPPSRHRPLTGSQSVTARSATATLPPHRSHLNGHVHHRSLRGHHGSRSQSSLSSHAPPVPPRSSTSLANEMSNGVSRNPAFAGRSATLHMKQHSTPARSSSVMDHTSSGYHSNGRYGYDSASQVESGSNTVFIQHVSHHLKDRPRLAHMV